MPTPDPNAMATLSDVQRVDARVTDVQQRLTVLENARLDVQPFLDRIAALEHAVSALQGTLLPVVNTVAPRNLQITVTGRVVVLRWTPPSAGTPNGYVVYAGSEPGKDNLFRTAVPPTPTQYRAEGVDPKTYFVRVTAVWPSGESAPSNEVQIDVR